MLKKDKIYITTTLPYVNASPHVGFALEIVQADSFARFNRLVGKEVFFNTGTDEHGQKIAEAAKKADKTEKAYVDFYAEEFKKLASALNLSPDNFVRTTDKVHENVAKEFWMRAYEKGDLEERHYKGLYCVGCEAFLTETDLTETGECPNHPGKALEEIEEKNWFFKLCKYKDELRRYLDTEGSVIPEFRRKEAISILDSLEDISVSRPKERNAWGILVPNDESQVMYVWFDALSNYVSTLVSEADKQIESAENYKKFWEEGLKVQFAGKDQVKFQSVIWQAMLLSAGLPLTNTVFYHGFINSGGQKMSKSLGNVISPYDLVEKYGTDGARYILLRHVHPTGDTDLTWDRMNEWYTANLVNGLGNLVSRVMKMSETHIQTPVHIEEVGFSDTFLSSFMNFDFNKATDYVWNLITQVDERITTEEPFKVVKKNKAQACEMIESYVKDLSVIAKHLEPLMPESSATILNAIRHNKKPENMFCRLN